jgi:ubiquinone/menaquinone biosynthesis C-methylase UbiE
MESEDRMQDAVARHYARAPLLDAILSALQRQGKDLAHLTPLDLAAVDEFHIRGREATVELAALASLQPGLRVLDVGCGLGGSVRYLASQHACRAIGIDLTAEYVNVATALARLVGLESAVEFREANALALPFMDQAFDVVWTQHVQMNIADKDAFYRELARVLEPGGRLVFHDVFRGEGGAPHFPVPWAEDESISFLADVDVARAAIERAGLRIAHWEDLTQRSLDWISEKMKAGGRAPLGLHLLMGDNASIKSANNVANLRERRMMVIQARCEKP